jgi:hypothetical protein
MYHEKTIEDLSEENPNESPEEHQKVIYESNKLRINEFNAIKKFFEGPNNASLIKLFTLAQKSINIKDQLLINKNLKNWWKFW